MSTEEDDETTGEGDEGEQKSVFGEDSLGLFDQYAEPIIEDKYLSFEEASRCLNTLGKDESGSRYAYLAITATDRKLTDVSAILNFQHVLFVDVSGNYLTLESLQVLAEMPFLILLRAQRNRIDSAAFTPLPYLQVLDLGRNQILNAIHVEQPMLNILQLNFNQIYEARFNSAKLPELTQLELRANYLPSLAGSFPVSLENLYVAENRINRIMSFDVAKLVNLKILHLRENRIRKLDGFSAALANLTYLNLRGNRINKFRQFRKLSVLPALETLIIKQNPVAGDLDEIPGEGGADEEGEEAEKEDITRIPLLVLLPNLKRINKLPVTLEERQEADETKEDKLEEIMAEESSDEESVTSDMGTPDDITE